MRVMFLLESERIDDFRIVKVKDNCCKSRYVYKF